MWMMQERENKMVCYYLDHSGFAFHTGSRWLIFDYFTDAPQNGTLADGVIDPAAFSEEQVFVFVSHRHHDHFNPVIFSWREQIRNITYILSDDVPAQEDTVRVSPHQVYRIQDMTVETLESTDEGVAFLIWVDGLCLYFAGDLNHWHWEGEPDWYNRDMKEKYLSEMERLRGTKIDFAFVPVDPRLGDAFYLGAKGVMETTDVNALIPMHVWGDYSVVGRLKGHPEAEKWKDKVLSVSRRGEKIFDSH